MENIKTTNFQKKVYNEVKKIPRGETRSYKFIAEKLNSSPRAVGQALKKNKDSNVPCHRVIKSNGNIGGYKGNKNSDEKRELLKKEKAI